MAAGIDAGSFWIAEPWDYRPSSSLDRSWR